MDPYDEHHLPERLNGAFLRLEHTTTVYGSPLDMATLAIAIFRDCRSRQPVEIERRSALLSWLAPEFNRATDASAASMSVGAGRNLSCELIFTFNLASRAMILHVTVWRAPASERQGKELMMRSIILAGMFVLPASISWAQTTTSPQPAAPAADAQSDQTAAPQQGGPANLCQEILAFMKAPPPEAAAPAGEAKPAEPPAQQSASAEQDASSRDSAAEEDASDADPAQEEVETGSAQEITGQDGVATDAPEPGNDNAASGSAMKAPQKESRAAPLPPEDVTSTPKESVLTVEAAEQLASANDIAECQKAAREMRVAGVSMPPPLMALAALDLQYHETSGAAAEPSDAARPAEEE